MCPDCVDGWRADRDFALRRRAAAHEAGDLVREWHWRDQVELIQDRIDGVL